MSYTARQIVEPLERIAPGNTQEGWDNSGFIVGNPDAVVTQALVGLDCTPELVDEAVEVGANLIITHHPLIFGGVKRISPTDFVGNTIIKLIQNNITLYSAHTNLDKAAEGVSRLMANKLLLENCAYLSADNFGLVGDLAQPVDSKDFIQLVKKLFGVEALKCSRPIENKIYRVAVCGGAGRDFISDARAAGAQAYITGDVSYHFFYPYNDFMIMDIGHYESEVDIVKFIKDLVCENFANFAIRTTKKNNNPVYYY